MVSLVFCDMVRELPGGLGDVLVRENTATNDHVADCPEVCEKLPILVHSSQPVLAYHMFIPAAVGTYVCIEVPPSVFSDLSLFVMVA